MDFSEMENNQYCGFKIDGEEYAIPVMKIQEVIKPLPVTTVPLAQSNVRGLINLRGQIVTCVSVRKQFGIEDRLEDDYMNIIVKGDDGLFSLVVDEVTDIIEVVQNNIEPAPETLKPKLKKFVDSVFKLEKGLIILLNVEGLIKLNSTEDPNDKNMDENVLKQAESL